MEFFDGKWGSSPAKAAPKPPPNNGKAPQPVALGNMAAAAAAAAAAQRSQHFANAKDVSPELKTPKHMSMPQESLKHVPAYEPRLPSPPPPAEPPKMPWSDFDGKAAWATFRENAVTFDEQVFGCWSERPWRPMAGGASHLKTKKKAASIGRLSAAKSPFLTPGRVTTQPQTSDGAGQQQQQQQVLPPAVPQVQEWVTDADLKQAFKAPGNLCALKIKIRAEQTSSWLATKLSCLPTLSSASDGSAIMTFSLDTTASGRGRFIEDLRTVRRMLEDNEACFVLFCSGGASSWVLFAFVPADATAQQKAVYKWGERALITSLGGQARIPWREHWSDLKPLDELAASLESAPESPDQGATSEAVPMTRPLGGFGSGPSHVDEGETYENPDDKFERMWANRWMLTDVERMSLEGEREARARNAAYKARKEAMQAEASSSVPAAAAPIPAPPASLKFPLTNTALSAAETFIGGGNSGFVLAIEEEVLVLRETIHKTQTMDGLREQLENEPCFVLFHWEHEWQGERRQATLFMFVRPEDAPLRQKMMHASSMRPLVTNLQAKGVEITKIVDGLELDEVNDAELRKQLYVYE